MSNKRNYGSKSANPVMSGMGSTDVYEGGGTEITFTKPVFGIKARTAISSISAEDMDGEVIVRNYITESLGMDASEYHTFPEGLLKITCTGTFIVNYA